MRDVNKSRKKRPAIIRSNSKELLGSIAERLLEQRLELIQNMNDSCETYRGYNILVSRCESDISKIDKILETLVSEITT